MKKIFAQTVSLFTILTCFLVAQSAHSNPHPDITEMQKPLVVLLHGLGRSSISLWLLASRLEDAGFQVERIGYRSLDLSPDEAIESVGKKINACCASYPGPVHFVGYSLGGLLVRAYLQQNVVERLGRVVLIGTPNQGSDLVDEFGDNYIMSLLGPTAAALGTGNDGLPARLARPDYPVGVIAGVTESEWNDRWLPGPDDGLVSVESTKLRGMSDFVKIESGHSMMRYNRQVARQTIAFLKTGRFSQ